MTPYIGSLLLLPMSICSAQDTFNIVHNYTLVLGWPDAGGAEGRSVMEVDSGFLVFGGTIDVTNHGKPRTMRFGTAGAFQEEVEHFISTLHNYNFGYSDPVHKDASGAIAALSEFDYDGDTTVSVFLTRYNEAGDSLWGSTVLDTCTCGVRQLRLTSTGLAAMTGFNVVNAMLLLADTSGAIDTLRTYANTSDGLTVRPLLDGGFVIAGYRLGGMDNHCWVIRTDSSGDQLWRKDIGGSHFASQNICAIQTQDGGILAASSFMSIGSFPTDPEWAYFRKWDVDGNLQWTKQYNLQYISTTYDVEELPDGSLIVSGTEISTIYGANGLLYRLEADGDLTWMRRYSYYAPSSGLSIPYDVESTSDGGFVMTGQAQQGSADSLPGLQMVWLVRTDSMGCLVPGCGGIGIQEVVIGLEDALSVFPNPTSGFVNVRIGLPSIGRPLGLLKLFVTGMDGRVVRTIALPALHDQQIELDVRDLAAGTYAVHVADDVRLYASKLLRVE